MPDAELIIEKFNAHIVEMVKDGSYNRILHLDWVKADIDGDGVPELVADGKYAGISEPSSGYSILHMESDTVSDTQNRYYVEGRIYEAWDQLPATYKVPPPDDDAAGVNLAWLTF